MISRPLDLRKQPMRDREESHLFRRATHMRSWGAATGRGGGGRGATASGPLRPMDAPGARGTNPPSGAMAVLAAVANQGRTLDSRRAGRLVRRVRAARPVPRRFGRLNSARSREDSIRTRECRGQQPEATRVSTERRCSDDRRDSPRNAGPARAQSRGMNQFSEHA